MVATTFDLPLKVAALMRSFKPLWFIAGGWAIDLYLGRSTRPHADLEIGIFRRDQFALRAHLGAWQWQQVFNGTLSRWQGERLDWPRHELYCTNERAEPARLEVLLNESQGDRWVFRRNAKITRPIVKCYRTTAFGLNVLAPEIVLLYKAKDPRAKDEADFAVALAHLDAEPRAWLRAAIAACHAQHHWLHRL